MAGSGDRGDGAGKPPEGDREALRQAFADVKPLPRAPRKRAMPAPEDLAARSPEAGREAQQPVEPLIVERESNGIILGRRRATHSSIVASLEDPSLEIQAQCDLHGHTAAEAEREMHRFLRECQRSGKRWVLLIVGKGLHSPEGKGTLKAEMVDALSRRASARLVLAFRTAPRHLGGTGALVARLVDRL
jgi:DNA-nicking Smr family endonuclease